jgi:hypothetical protein
MNDTLYGQIRGYLMAVESFNRGEPYEWLEFKFEHVRNTGDLIPSLSEYAQAEWDKRAEWSDGPDPYPYFGYWKGRPHLCEQENWKYHLNKEVNNCFHYIMEWECENTAESFMNLLEQFFEGGDVKVWRVEWFESRLFKPKGHQTHPIQHTEIPGYVFEHQNEIFLLTIFYSD